MALGLWVREKNLKFGIGKRENMCCKRKNSWRNGAGSGREPISCWLM